MPINVLDILCINVWTLHVPHVHGGETGCNASDFNFSRLRGTAHTETLNTLNTVDRSVLTKTHMWAHDMTFLGRVTSKTFKQRILILTTKI